MQSTDELLYTDALPHFLRPLWHTFTVSLYETASCHPSPTAQTDQYVEPVLTKRVLTGHEAASFLRLNFRAKQQRGLTDGSTSDYQMQQFSFRVPGELYAKKNREIVLGVQVEVEKTHVHMEDFSFAAEKGFDLGSAAYILRRGTGGGKFSGSDTTSKTGGEAEAECYWYERIFLTEGLIVNIQMPDFSMPFNVICLTSTVMSLFFSQLIKFVAVDTFSW